MTIAICSIAGPVIILFTVLPYGWGIYALLLLVGTVIFARMSASETFIVSQTPPGSRSTILGIYFFAGMEGGGILTPVLGYAIDHLGFSDGLCDRRRRRLPGDAHLLVLALAGRENDA